MANVSQLTVYEQVTPVLHEVRRLGEALAALENRLMSILATLEADSGAAAQPSHPSPEPTAQSSVKLLAAAIEKRAGAEVSDGNSDDFTLIRGIDSDAAAKLNQLRLTRFSDLAAFTPEDVHLVGETIGSKTRISEQNWIEQAALLAAGTDTYYARQKIAVAAYSTSAVEPPAIVLTESNEPEKVSIPVVPAAPVAREIAPVVDARASSRPLIPQIAERPRHRRR